MKSIPFLLDGFSSRGIFLSASGDGISYRGPAGALASEDKAVIRDRKGDFLTYLRARAAAETGPSGATLDGRPSFYQEVWWNWFKDVPRSLPYEQIHLMRRFANVPVSVAAAALAKIVGRHDALRMNFRETQAGLMAGVQNADAFRAEAHVLDDESRLAPLLQQCFSQSPRVRDDWLTRAWAIGLPGGDCVIAIAMHHTVCDGASYQRITAELDAETAEPGSLPPAGSLSYREFAAAERNWFRGERFSALTAYWAQWIGRIPVLTSPEQKRPLVWSFGERVVAQTFLGRDVPDRLAQVSTSLRTSPFILVLTGFILALKDWSGQSHFAVRSVADGRTHASIGSTVGLILRHYLVEADVPPDWEIAQLVKAVACEYESGAELRCPTHWEISGADFRSLHQRIAPTLNYLAVSSAAAEAAALGSAAGDDAVTWKAPEPWPAWLPPVQLRVMHFTDKIALIFEFNGTLLTKGEQQSLVGSFVQAMNGLLMERAARWHP